jgi:hypothetical protein
MGNKDRLNRGELTILSAAAATGAGTAMKVSGFRHVIVSIATDGGGDADLTVKCQGSIQETAPTWTDAQSVTNHYDFIAMADYEDATFLDGDTGFVVAAADDYRLFMVNVDGLQWLNFRVTARAEGEVTVKARAFSNI